MHSTLYYKLFAQHNAQHAYTLCVSFNAHSTLTQRNALQFATLCDITQHALQSTLQRLQQQHNAQQLCNLTSSAVSKKLARYFAKLALQ